MAIKEESNHVSEFAEVFLDSVSVGFAVVGVVNPAASLIAPLINLASIPFAVHNSSFAKRKINEIISEVNKHEIRLEKIEKITEEQNEILTLNGYKFF